MRDKYRFQLYNQGFNKTPLGKHYADLIANSKGRDRQYYYQSRKQYVRITYDIAQAKRDRAIDAGKVRKEKARLAALRKSNRVRRFRNTSHWFVQYTPLLLLGFMVAIFFGGLTNGFIQAHSETVVYRDVNGVVSDEVSYDVFDYDYTFKLQQLSKMRNIFSIHPYQNDNQDLLLSYRDTLTNYYNDGLLRYTGSNTIAGISQQWESNIKYWGANVSIDDSRFTEIVDLLNTQFTDGTKYYYACNMFGINDGQIVVSNPREYTKNFTIDKYDGVGFLQGLENVGRILFVYPMTIIINLGWDLGVAYNFIFNW